MIVVERCLVDAGILLRLCTSTRDRFPWVYQAVRKLQAGGCELCFTRQVAAEFLYVSTRPICAQGHGLSRSEAVKLLAAAAEAMTLLPENSAAESRCNELIATHRLSGARIHDARLAADMLTHNLSHLLTLDTASFANFAGIETLHPSAI